MTGFIHSNLINQLALILFGQKCAQSNVLLISKSIVPKAFEHDTKQLLPTKTSFDIENELKADMLKFIYETNTTSEASERENRETQLALWLCVEKMFQHRVTLMVFINYEIKLDSFFV